MAKPKQVKVRLIDRPHEVYDLLDRAVAAWHPDLAEVNWAACWQETKADKDGKRVLAKAYKASDRERELGADADAAVFIDEELWGALDDRQKLAVLDHEASHLAASEDRDGNPRRDDRGRLVLRYVKHDIAEFKSVIDRHGLYMADVQEFARVALRHTKDLGPTLFKDEAV